MLQRRMLSTLVFFTAISALTAQQGLKVVAASNIKEAMDSIVTIYELHNPEDEVQVIYGSSGKFYEQIQNGAPFDLFFSADRAYPEQLQKRGFTTSKIKIYAIGRLAVWSKKIDPNRLKENSLLEGSIKKIAIGNPITAPYGTKALESLQYYNLYDRVKNKLVYGENIAQTAQFVAFGAADIGIIALSDALSPKMKREGGRFYVLPDTSHSPLEQACVVLNRGKPNPQAATFYDFISTPEAVKILSYFGYSQEQQ